MKSEGKKKNLNLRLDSIYAMKWYEGDYEQLKMVRGHIPRVSGSTTCLRIKTSCPTGAAAFLLSDYEAFQCYSQGSHSFFLYIYIRLSDKRPILSDQSHRWYVSFFGKDTKEKKSKIAKLWDTLQGLTSLYNTETISLMVWMGTSRSTVPNYETHIPQRASGIFFPNFLFP